LSIVCAYALGKTLAGRYAGIALGLCVVIAPLSLDVGMEARPYGMIIALATLTLLAFFRALQRENIGWTIAFASGALVLGATHYTAIVFVGIVALTMLMMAFLHRGSYAKDMPGARPVIVAALAVALLNAAWLITATQDRSRIHVWSEGAQGSVLTPLDDGLNYFAPFGTMN